MGDYPESRSERDRWILSLRDPAWNRKREQLDASLPHSFFSENERSERGEVVPVNTLLLTNRECPWRCLMCDLWQNTLLESVPVGAIPRQIDFALSRLPAARQIKLYNSGSFFDPKAIPPEDYPGIAQRLQAFERVIVESHPALVGDGCLRFRDLLSGQLEIAMGLETVHPEVVLQLNKGMTLSRFREAAEFLDKHQVALRVFILVKPPFLNEEEALYWAERSLDFSFDCHATASVLIPTRAGNGALEELARQGKFSPPQLATVEAALEYGIKQQRGRVFADLWDLEKIVACPHCFSARSGRLKKMNLEQRVLPSPNCPVNCR